MQAIQILIHSSVLTFHWDHLIPDSSKTILKGRNNSKPESSSYEGLLPDFTSTFLGLSLLIWEMRRRED